MYISIIYVTKTLKVVGKHFELLFLPLFCEWVSSLLNVPSYDGGQPWQQGQVSYHESSGCGKSWQQPLCL